jgi:hypothetical protein
VPPGTYKVTVIDLGEAEPDPMAVKVSRPRSRVPAALAKPATTPVSLTIEAGKLDYDLALPTR